MHFQQRLTQHDLVYLPEHGHPVDTQWVSPQAGGCAGGHDAPGLPGMFLHTDLGLQRLTCTHRWEAAHDFLLLYGIAEN